MAANNKTTAKRGRGKPFEPGKSGNPSGRPKIPEEFKQLAKDYSVEALQTIINIMNDRSAKHADRIRASEIVLDRAWGKPTQGMELSGPEGNAISIVLEGDLQEWAK